MKLSDEHCYQIIHARDARYDGLLYVGVRSTGIYCRPVCPAIRPNANRCRFFANPAAAEQSGFRPCLRCRPELAPGLAPMDGPTDWPGHWWSASMVVPWKTRGWKPWPRSSISAADRYAG